MLVRATPPPPLSPSTRRPLRAAHRRSGERMWAVLFLGGLLVFASSQREPMCPITDVRKVPPGTFGSTTWNELYWSFLRYRGCDHGGEFSHSYTEDVVRLLARDWDSLPEAAPLFVKSPSFLRFVERHV